MAQFHPLQSAMSVDATQQQHHQQQPNGLSTTAGILGVNGDIAAPLNEPAFCQVCL